MCARLEIDRNPCIGLRLHFILGFRFPFLGFPAADEQQKPWGLYHITGFARPAVNVARLKYFNLHQTACEVLRPDFA
jgi:hypothetical protein